MSALTINRPVARRRHRRYRHGFHAVRTEARLDLPSQKRCAGNPVRRQRLEVLGWAEEGAAPEEIVEHHRQADVLVHQGKSAADAALAIGVTEHDLLPLADRVLQSEAGPGEAAHAPRIPPSQAPPSLSWISRRCGVNSTPRIRSAERVASPPLQRTRFDSVQRDAGGLNVVGGAHPPRLAVRRCPPRSQAKRTRQVGRPARSPTPAPAR